MFKSKKYLITIAVTMSDGTTAFVNEFATLSKLTSGSLAGYVRSAKDKSNAVSAAITFIKELEG